MRSIEWKPGNAPVAVIMITLNESHNIEDVLANIAGWAQEVFVVDSYSDDTTVEIARRHGVAVVQREFMGFGDQWNFAVNDLPVQSRWTMKLDPDERLSDQLKESIISAASAADAEGLLLKRRLWFMGQPLPITQDILRVWKTGRCRFTNVPVNEHPIVDGPIKKVSGYLEHHDSPDLHHWVRKQNRYTSAEALARHSGQPLAAAPRLFGSKLERRMWFKKHYRRIPFRYQLQLIANLLMVQPWRTGRTGLTWARLRVWARRLVEDKLTELEHKSDSK